MPREDLVNAIDALVDEAVEAAEAELGRPLTDDEYDSLLDELLAEEGGQAVAEGSYFADCDRDEHGHCTGSGAADPGPANPEHDRPHTPEEEGQLHEAADRHSRGILARVAALPAAMVPQKVKDTARAVKDWGMRKLVERYGERVAGLIVKAAVLSAPIPVPGSQPIAIALSLAAAEAARALGYAGPALAAEGAGGELTLAEVHAAAADWLAALRAELLARLAASSL